MAGRKVLLIEDDPLIAESVTARLRADGFEVHVARDGLTGVALAESERPDLIVLDLMLPGLDGLEVCRRVQRDRVVPVLILTARDDEADVLTGLAVGADDYMTKPFSPRELVARVHVLLRRIERSAEFAASVPTSGSLRIDTSRRQVFVDGDIVHLTPTEFDLLLALASRNGAVLTREQLLRDVWGYLDGSGARTVDSHIRSLRRKLGDDSIRTVHGVGYAFGNTES